ncbi:hypothetical protein JXC34_02775 [Candidatus Woesearchaeota archaeon]|nr:hypothetical protein [Candidatus Woesearchaeota archaeon]
MKKLITYGLVFLATIACIAASEPAELASVPEFNSLTMGAACIFGGLGYAIIRKK